MKRTPVVFSGYYGMRNFGDDLFGRIGVEGQKHYWPWLESKVIGITDRSVLADWYLENSFRGRSTRLLVWSFYAMSAQRFIYCGGSLFSKVGGVRRYTDMLSRANLSAIGVSIGPFPSRAAEQQVRTLLKDFEFIAVRDRASFSAAQEMNLGNVVLAADLAGLVRSVFTAGPSAKQSDEALRIGFSPCASPSENSLQGKDFCREFIAAVRALSKSRQVSVDILLLNEHPDSGDGALAEFVRESLMVEGVAARKKSYLTLGLEGIVGEISSLDVYVTGRLHGALVGYIYNVPVILHEYHRKCSDFLDDVGQNERLRVREPGVLGQAIDAALTNRLTPAVSASEYAEAATLNFIGAPWAREQ